MATEQVNVRFGADTGPLRSGVNQAKQTLNSLKTVATGIGASIASALAIGGARSIISEFARIQDLADRFGTSAESMQKLGFVAEQNGADIEQMATALQKATRSGQDAANGNKAAAEAFQRLNINVAKFNAASPEEKLAMLAEGFQGAKTEGEGMAAILAIVGRAGGELIPTLRMTGDEIREMGASFNTASNEAVQSMAQLDDAIAKMTASAKGPLAELIAMFVKVADTILEVARSSGSNFGSIVGFISQAIKAAATGNKAAIDQAFELMLSQIETQDEIFKAKVNDIWNPVIEPPKAQSRPAEAVKDPRLDPFSTFGVGTDADEYGPANDAEAARKARLKKEIAGNQMGESINVLQAGLDAAIEKRKGLDPGSVIADSLASIGGGGGVFGTSNPMIGKMDAQIAVLENSLAELKRVNTSIRKGRAMQ